MILEETLPILACPGCHHHPLGADVRERDGQRLVEADLACEGCGRHYPVSGGVPDMVPADEMSDEEWGLWKKHLDGFQARREKRSDLMNRVGQAGLQQTTFAEFMKLERGRLLDVGCGPGNFRFAFEGKPVDYVGLDPIPLAEVEDFVYLRGLGEWLPFADDQFAAVTVLSSLDHFNDVDAFCREVVRILEPGGRFHLLQSVHEVRGPVSLLKWLAHEAKDLYEDRTTKAVHREAPKHMNEYETDALRRQLERHFEIVAEDRFTTSLLSPQRLFLSMAPRSSAS